MDNKLTFISTYSLDGFKQNVANDTELEILSNGNGNFFSCGKAKGTVAKSFDSSQDIKVSEVVGDKEDATPFYLLHNRGEGAAEVVETL